MPLGKTLRLYLSDGSPTGPIVAEIINWTGQVIVVPRPQLHEMAKREELQRTGIFILVGPDAQTSADRIYVGEADDVFDRLKTHAKDDTKDFWTRAVTITSKDFNLTKAHGRYLEGRLIELGQICRPFNGFQWHKPRAEDAPRVRRGRHGVLFGSDQTNASSAGL